MASENAMDLIKNDVARLVSELNAADPTDNAKFHSLVQDVIGSLGIDNEANIKELAKALDVSVPTASRYVSGKGRPHPAMRPRMYKIMSELIKKVWLED